MTDEQLEKAILKLRKLRPRRNDHRGRFAADEFLAQVFKLWRRLRDEDASCNCKNRLAALFGIRLNQRRSLVRVILDLTCDDTHPKIRSRWTRGLRWLWREGRHRDDVADFLRSNGGPAGCAKRWAYVQPSPVPKDMIQIGGFGFEKIRADKYAYLFGDTVADELRAIAAQARADQRKHTHET